MEGQYGFCPREERAYEAKAEEPSREVSTDVQVDDVVPESRQQPEQLPSGLWIVDVTYVSVTETSEVDHATLNSALLEEISQRYNVSLDPAMRWWVGAEL
jgi:membrane-bound lytic murein transglycosylase B